MLLKTMKYFCLIRNNNFTSSQEFDFLWFGFWKFCISNYGTVVTRVIGKY